MTTINERRDVLPSLDGVRGLGAMVVVAVHADYYFSGFWHITPFYHRLAGGHLHLEVIVDTFFVLSGLVMSHVYSSRMANSGTACWREFYIARVARILPLYFATLAGVALIAPYTLISPIIDMGNQALVRHLTFTGFTHPALAWNYPSWSVQVEMYAYLIYPFAAIAVARCTKRWMVFAGLALCALALFFLSVPGRDLNIVIGPRSLARGICGFIAGMLLYELWRTGWTQAHRRLIVIFTCACLLLLAVTRRDTVLLIAQAALVVLCLDASIWMYRPLNSAALRRLGEISYSLYLWHPTVHYAVAAGLLASGMGTVIGGASGAVLAIAATLLGTFVVACWSYAAIERPGRRWLRIWLLAAPARRPRSGLRHGAAIGFSSKPPLPYE